MKSSILAKNGDKAFIFQEKDGRRIRHFVWLFIQKKNEKKYLLDTCILSALKKPTADGHIQAVTRLNALDDDDEVYISILSIYELEAGASHTLNLDLL